MGFKVWVLSPTATWCLLIGRRVGGMMEEMWQESDGGWGAADAAVPPGVRKRGHDGYS